MKIYLDCAVATRWKVPPGCPPVAGVTTNPSLIFQAGLRVDLPTYLHLVHAAGERGLDGLTHVAMDQFDRDTVVSKRQF